MRLAVHILQALLDDVGVELCGGDVRVAQHLLNGAQVRPVFQQMDRKGVSQGVGVMSLVISALAW